MHPDIVGVLCQLCPALLEDGGEVGCIAQNRSGEASFTVYTCLEVSRDLGGGGEDIRVVATKVTRLGTS